MLNLLELSKKLDLDNGIIPGAHLVERRLSNLANCFTDSQAYHDALSKNDPLIYSVSTITPAEGSGALHYGLGMLYPGTIGQEYYFTKGHVHAWVEATEVYIGLKGTGLLLLDNIETGESQVVELLPNTIVYVPGKTAHRTVNTGTIPLLYLGIYPADASHDYTFVDETNFRHIVININGQAHAIERASYTGG